MNKIYTVLAEKDMKVLFANRIMWMPMLIVPLLFTVLIPTAIFITAGYTESMGEMDDIKPLLMDAPEGYTQPQLFIYFTINFLLPGIFLIIPIMLSSVLAGNSFVGEKENKTIETLLYTPLSIKELLAAKILGALIPSYLFTLLSFIVFAVIVMSGQAFYFERPFFPNWNWIVLIFWLSPAVSLLGITLMVNTSAKSKTFQEAQQRVLFIILPVIFIVLGQATGLFYLNAVVLFAVGAVVFIIDYFMLTIGASNYIPEKLVT
jgi:ABC-type Na+ efflux pump permease subunit